MCDQIFPFAKKKKTKKHKKDLREKNSKTQKKQRIFFLKFFVSKNNAFLIHRVVSTKRVFSLSLSLFASRETKEFYNTDFDDDEW